MTITLFDLTYWVARNLPRGVMKDECTATGGSVSTIVDTNDRIEDPNRWNRGTVWIIKTHDSAAPQNEFGIITTFAAGTINLRTPLTAAVAAGDMYAICRSRFPLTLLISKVNQAIHELGDVPVTDMSLTTLTNVYEYTLPVLANFDLRQIWVASTTDANDYGWVLRHDVDIQHSVTGSGDKIIFNSELAAGYKIKLVYAGAHPELLQASAILNDHVDPDFVVFKATELCLIDKNATGEYNPLINRMNALAAQAQAAKPAMVPQREPRLLLTGW